ncbi:disease resistance RPP8-like protein 3 [Salvia divinorum]|uniref:Disease resistance RPP8-like protein 3 n=1 Tax=Salvia divinorum TaxID=28513 RepID=A0ABD1H7U2_SALDI
MAEAATEFLLNNLKEVVKHHVHLVRDAKGNIEKLERDLNAFKAFLKDTVKIRKKEEKIMNMWKEIHDVVYEIEDVIDFYLAKTNEEGRQGRFARLMKNRAATLHSVGQKVENIKGRVDVMKEEIRAHKFEEDKDETSQQSRPPRKTDVVGFEDVTNELKQRLLQETDYFDVISLIGMLGLGKTTLAWKIYNDQDINLRFPTRIWVSVSAQFTDKEIFLRILNELTTLNDDIRAKNGSELADIVAAHLQNGRFLIVLDDVWTYTAWERLRAALPSDNTNTRGKVLITSRLKEVGKVASKPRRIKELRFFTEEESWELFQLEALGKRECPYELVPSGRKIATSCGGLPLAIVVIGGILFKSLDSNLNATKREWEKVSEHVSSYIDGEDETKRMQKFISLSYENLPHHLRHCFLYLGLFPEDCQISALKLIRMWIGEGFIQHKDEYNSLEEIGYKYLQDLISRNLLKCVKFTPDGNVKTCQIHDVLHEFCRNEAATENFLQEIKYNDEGIRVPPSSNTCRRLSIHSKLSYYISSKPSAPCARSFVCFSKSDHPLTPQDGTKIIEAFKLLRVFDVQHLKFSTIDREFYNLVHLRYIAMSFTLPILPSHFNKLWNIQTLIIDTPSPTLTLSIEADIWKLKHLRHFKTKASARLLNSTNSSDSTNELQTLSLISVESCTKELPSRARNLKKLGIGGRLSLLFRGEVGSLDSLRNMEHLRKLKLVNDEQQDVKKLNCLPRYDQFPPGLRSLTLCSISLSWLHISTLGSLDNLEVLKLKKRAFIGHTWDVKDGGFCSLQFLHIEETDLAFWRASSHHYPKLRNLVLKDCDKLREIPIELADISSFEMLDMHTCILAVKSAKEIKKKKTEAGGSKFTLSAYPSIE